MLYSLSPIRRGLILALSFPIFLNSTTASPTNCKVITIPVSINMQTLQLPLDLAQNFLSLIGGVIVSLTSLLRFDVVETYNIVGRYCEPENNVASRKNTLQLLAHPTTYTKDWVNIKSSIIYTMC
jgi:hypothetical protein